MGVGERQAVAPQPGARDPERQRVGGRRVGHRGAQHSVEFVGRGHRIVALQHEGAGEGGNLFRLLLGRQDVELRVDRVDRPPEPVRDRLGGGERGHLCREPFELEPLHPQPQAQRVPPADIGAPIGVVADPGC